MADDTEYIDPEYLAEPEEREDPLPIEKPRKATVEERKSVALPVGQAETEGTMHGLVKVTRSLSLGSRNDQIHIGCEHPYVVQPGWTLPQQAVALSDAFGVAKSVVYTQAGLDYTVNDEGVLMEVMRQMPGTERVAESRAVEHDGGERRNGSGGDFPHPADMDRPAHIDREVWADLCDHYDEWYDNRRDKASGKYKDTAPDFKRAEDSETVWLRPFRRENARRGGGGGRQYRD